jgi:ribosomal protein S18 acetylase RimI-like enzyme
LYCQELGEDPVSGLIYFGVIEETDAGPMLQAVASVKNYMGSWYLRGCVVKPEYRDLGLQRKLIRERLEYLAARTDMARVSIFPHNEHSICNIEAEGFRFERKKKLGDGSTVLVYKTELSGFKPKKTGGRRRV